MLFTKRKNKERKSKKARFWGVKEHYFLAKKKQHFFYFFNHATRKKEKHLIDIKSITLNCTKYDIIITFNICKTYQVFFYALQPLIKGGQRGYIYTHERTLTTHPHPVRAGGRANRNNTPPLNFSHFFYFHNLPFFYYFSIVYYACIFVIYFAFFLL